MSWIWNIKLRLLVGGPILIILGLALYLVRGTQAALVLPVVGIVLLIVGVLWKPRKRADEVGNSSARVARDFGISVDSNQAKRLSAEASAP